MSAELDATARETITSVMRRHMVEPIALNADGQPRVRVWCRIAVDLYREGIDAGYDSVNPDEVSVYADHRLVGRITYDRRGRAFRFDPVNDD